MPPKKFEDTVNELVAAYPLDRARCLAEREAEKRECTRIKQNEALGTMQKTVNKSAQELRHEVKALLAREMDIDEVAEALGVSKDRVVDCIVYYDMEEFIQPSKRKQEWRESLPRGLNTECERESFENVVKQMAKYHYNSLRNKGWNLHFDDVLSDVCEVYLKCAKGFQDKQGGASFKTYLNRAVTNHFITWQKRAIAESDMFESHDDDRGYGHEYPTKTADGRYKVA